MYSNFPHQLNATQPITGWRDMQDVCVSFVDIAMSRAMN